MIYLIFNFLFYLFLEPIKRILSALLYPFAYVIRNDLRDRRLLKGLMVNGYLYYPIFKPLWYLLDDSIHIEQGRDYNYKESCYPKWIWKTQSEFLLSWWWSGIRNSCVNWNNYSAWKLGKFIKVIRSYGDESFDKIKQDKQGYRIELRRYYNGDRVYLEFYLLKRWYQFGWLSGNMPRFEIDLFKNK